MRWEQQSEIESEDVDDNSRVTEDDIVDDDTAADEMMHIPIDHGWAWVIVLGSFGVFAIAVGIIKSFGVLLVELSRRYNAPASSLAFSQSLCSCLHLALGTVANALSIRFSHRRVVFAGGILAGVGLFTSAFVTSFEWFFVTYGLMTGVGLGLCLSPSLVLFGMFFRQHLALANGLAVSGSGFGSTLFPYLMLYLLTEFSIEGCMMILGAIALNICVFAALFRPFSFWERTHHVGRTDCVHRQGIRKTLIENGNKVDGKVIQFKEGFVKDYCRESYSPISSSTPCLKLESEAFRDRSATVSVHGTERKNDDSSSSRQNFIVPNAMLFASMESFSTYNNQISISRNNKQHRNGTMKRHVEENNQPEVKVINWSLLKDPLFQMLNWGIFCALYSHHTVYNFTPAMAEENGFSDSEGTMAVSVIGVSDLVGRISVGAISGVLPLQKTTLYRTSVVIFCVCVIILTFIKTFIPFVVLCGVAGIFTGGFAGIQISVIIEKLGMANLSSAWGYVAFCSSISLLVNPFVSGLIKDYTYTWKTALRLSSAIGILGAFILSLDSIVRRYKTRHK